MLFFILMSIFVLGIIVSITFSADSTEMVTLSGIALFIMVFFLSLTMWKYLELVIKVVN